jgi:type IV fimbrial biogenesis protein FimT
MPIQIRTRVRQNGFTLVELIFTLVIFAILLAMAIPSFSGLIASSRLSGTTNDLLAALAQTRAEAIRRGQRVTLCASANGTQCSNAGDWNQGWIIFTDGTPNVTASNATVDNNDAIIATSPASNNDILIQGQLTAGQPAIVRYVSFASNGLSRTVGAASQIQGGIIQVCTTSSSVSNDTRARNILINASGNVVMQAVPAIPINCPRP